MIRLIFISVLISSAAVFADEINLTTGEYIMDMGDGDSMNVTTGEYIMDID